MYIRFDLRMSLRQAATRWSVPSSLEGRIRISPCLKREPLGLTAGYPKACSTGSCVGLNPPALRLAFEKHVVRGTFAICVHVVAPLVQASRPAEAQIRGCSSCVLSVEGNVAWIATSTAGIGHTHETRKQ